MSIDTNYPARAQAVFSVEKETPGTIRFREFPNPGEAPIMRTAYVQKHVIQQLGNPEHILVTIEVVPAGG